ncbi:hypothetical protein BC828DRAFT_386128 [Blastocladiella britannica]|nr:hypothetical protein BC828DRAFT_386128 [Blastocladiella britannica]
MSFTGSDISSNAESLVQQLEDLYRDPTVAAAYWSAFQTTAAIDAQHQVAHPPSEPGVARVVAGAANRYSLTRFRLYHVEPDYYAWSLARRMARLHAPTRDHLCKTLVMQNTRHSATAASAAQGDPKVTYAKYYMVVVQYTRKLNAQRLLNYARDLAGGKIGKQHFNFRLVDPETSLELTGFDTGGVTPFGVTTEMPIILAAEVATKLDPGVMWLGAGHVDWKIAVPVREFVKQSACLVADIY